MPCHTLAFTRSLTRWAAAALLAASAAAPALAQCEQALAEARQKRLALPAAPALFPGFDDNLPGPLVVPDPAPGVALCYDAKSPPSPEVMAALDNAVRNSILRYYQTNRWSGSPGQPIALTYSFIPDGTMINRSGTIPSEQNSASVLFVRMDTLFANQGGRAAWIGLFQQCFDRWAELTGTSYTRVQFNGNAWDDGAAFLSSAGAAGLRGDIRIGAHPMDGSSGVLAYCYYPGQAAAGDIVLDSAENWSSTTNNFRFFRNILTHEHGHGLGLLHVCPTNGSKLMEPFLNTSFDGPQQDDIRGVMNFYGDAFEPNNTAAIATNLGNLSLGGSTHPSAVPNAPITNGSITAVDVNGDEDWFRVNLVTATTINVAALPLGLTYDNSQQFNNGACGSGNPFNSLTVADLAVQVRASNGTTVLATASGAGAGSPEVIQSLAMPAGQFYVRVFATNAPTQSQLYDLTISAGSIPAPTNDNCAGATPIGFGTYTGTTLGATQDGTSACAGNSTADVWYSFTPNCSGTLILDTCGSTYDTIISVHTGCPGSSGNQLGCNDDAGTDGGCSGTYQSYLAVPVVGGINYRVRVGGYGGAAGTFTLNVGFGPPANDDCSGAIAVSAGTTVGGQTCGATADGAASCGLSQGSPDVWYSYTPSCNHTLTLNLCGSNYDTVVSVFAGTCANKTEIACNDDTPLSCPSNMYASFLSTQVFAGVPYLIRVSGFAGSRGTYSMTIGAVQQANDTCVNAQTIYNGQYYGGTCGATPDGVAIGCGFNSNTTPDVWYSYTAGCTGNLVLSTCGSGFDTVIGVYTGSCGSLTAVGCDDDAGNNGICPGSVQSYLSVPVVSGATYLVRVTGYNGATGSFILTVSQQSNDFCEFAMNAPLGQTAFSTICSTRDGTDTCRSDATAGDVWFNHTASCTGTLWVSTCGSDYDTDITIYTGACGNLSQVLCNDDAGSRCGNGLNSFMAVPVTSGTSYKIRVSGYADYTGSGTLTLTCCRVDMNGDGTVNVQDFLAFLQFYSAADARADINGSGGVNVQDFLAFLQLYAQGC
jgi:hypothetical protein